MGKLYTIGHSLYDKEKFLYLIKIYNISYLLDVRSTPYSKHAPQFNADVIGKYLEENSVHYVDPYNYDLNLDDLMNEEIESPDKVLDKYSWDKSARLLYDLLKKMEI